MKKTFCLLSPSIFPKSTSFIDIGSVSTEMKLAKQTVMGVHLYSFTKKNNKLQQIETDYERKWTLVF